MANHLKDDGMYVFDEDKRDQTPLGQDGFLPFIVGLFTNRYFILSAIFVVFGVIILVMTTKLQFSGYQKTISSASVGIQRMYTVNAPRGDIYDCKT